MSSMVDVPTPPLKVLIAEGPWSMKEVYLNVPVSGKENELGYDVMVHKCPWKKNWLFKEHNVPLYIMLNEDPFCTNCNEKVPNMMQTLWTLKNLDKIQAGAQYGNKWIWGPSSFYLSSMIRPGQTLQYIPKPKSGTNWFYVPTLPKP